MNVRQKAELNAASFAQSIASLTSERAYLRAMAAAFAEGTPKAAAYEEQAKALDARLLELELEHAAAASVAVVEKTKDDAAHAARMLELGQGERAAAAAAKVAAAELELPRAPKAKDGAATTKPVVEHRRPKGK